MKYIIKYFLLITTILIGLSCDETDLLNLVASANSMLEYVISYETLNDA